MHDADSDCVVSLYELRSPPVTDPLQVGYPADGHDPQKLKHSRDYPMPPSRMLPMPCQVLRPCVKETWHVRDPDGLFLLQKCAAHS